MRFITCVRHVFKLVLDFVPVYCIIITPKPTGNNKTLTHCEELLGKNHWQYCLMTDLDLYWSSHYSLIWGRLWICTKLLSPVQPPERFKCPSSHSMQYVPSPSRSTQYTYRENTRFKISVSHSGKLTDWYCSVIINFKDISCLSYTVTEDTAMRTIYCMYFLEETFECHTALHLVRSGQQRQIWALMSCSHFQPIWLFFWWGQARCVISPMYCSLTMSFDCKTTCSNNKKMNHNKRNAKCWNASQDTMVW